jgi:LysR family transcriptional activator of glutamate synthase operon
MIMDVETLRWFQEVADGATVTEVSELEQTSQSGVSRALARLEAEVGTPLLRRSGRTLRMTHAGVAFKRHVDAMIHHLDDGLAAVQQIIDPEQGTVTLAFEPPLGVRLLPRLLSSFRRTWPTVRFDRHAKRDEHVLLSAGREQVDLDLCTIRPTTAEYGWQRLAKDPLLLAVPDEHPLAHREEITIADIEHEPLVTLLPTSRLRALTESLCEQAGFMPDIAFQCDELSTAQGYVSAGLGVAIVPTSMMSTNEPVRSELTYRAVADPGAVLEIGIAWSTQRRMLPAAEVFLTHCTDWADRAGDWLSTPRRSSST